MEGLQHGAAWRARANPPLGSKTAGQALATLCADQQGRLRVGLTRATRLNRRPYHGWPCLLTHRQTQSASYLRQARPPLPPTDRAPHTCTRPGLLFLRQTQRASYLCQAWPPQTQIQPFIPGTRPHLLRQTHRPSASYLHQAWSPQTQTDPALHTWYQAPLPQTPTDQHILPCQVQPPQTLIDPALPTCAQAPPNTDRPGTLYPEHAREPQTLTDPAAHTGVWWGLVRH